MDDQANGGRGGSLAWIRCNQMLNIGKRLVKAVNVYMLPNANHARQRSS